jgi:hypothetical protein
MQILSTDYIQADPHSSLETAFIADYLKGRGHTAVSLHALTASESMPLLRQASIYASAKLGEVVARSHYIHDIHGVSMRSC